MLGILRQYTSHSSNEEAVEKANTGLQQQQKPHPMSFTIYQFSMTCGMSSARSDVRLCVRKIQTSRSHHLYIYKNTLYFSHTFSSFAFMEAVMEVGLMNWKDGAALLGYWTGNITSILTLWLPQCTDTVQLRLTASICEEKQLLSS